jgi:hypothetical protein
MIRSVRIHEFGGPEVLRIEEIDVEEPGEGIVQKQQPVRRRVADRRWAQIRCVLSLGPFKEH